MPIEAPLIETVRNRPIGYDRVPADLVELDQWVLWLYELRNGRRTKVPYQRNGRKADTTDPRTWTTFEAVADEWFRRPTRYSGIGFVFSERDGFAGIDLDDSLDESGNPKSWARGIVEQFADTYMETSPSGQGLKIWARGSLPGNLPGVAVVDGSIEMYDHSRYFAFTGRAFRGAPLQIEEHASDLLTLYNRLTEHQQHWHVQPLTSGQIPHGQQHNTLVSLCGTLRARRVCEEAIEARLLLVNEKQCEKPGPREHIHRIVRSSRRWGAQ